jgi:hypothetical protein
MTDDQQRGEELDEALPDDFPPDEPVAADDVGTTGVEQLGGESFEERDRRTRPERGPRPRDGDGEHAEPAVETGVRPTDDEEEVLLPVDEARRADDSGRLAEDDEVSGDETARDVATERVTPPAEESAVRVENE